MNIPFLFSVASALLLDTSTLSGEKVDYLVPMEPLKTPNGSVFLYTGMPYEIRFKQKEEAMLRFPGRVGEEGVVDLENDHYKWKDYIVGGQNHTSALFILVRHDRVQDCFRMILAQDPQYELKPFVIGWWDDPSVRRFQISIEKKRIDVNNEKCFRFEKNLKVDNEVDDDGNFIQPGFVYWEVVNLNNYGPFKYVSNTPDGTIPAFDAFDDNSDSLKPGGTLSRDREEAMVSFTPDEASLSGTIVGIKFKEEEAVGGETKDVLLAQEHIYTNNASSAQTKTISFKDEVTQTYEFHFENNLKIFSKVTVQAGIELVGSVSVEAGFEAELKEGRSFSKSVTKSWSIEDTFTIAPFTRFKAAGLLKMKEGVEIPMTMTLRVSLVTIRLQELDCEACYKAVTTGVSHEYVQKYLAKNKVEGKIVSIEGDDLIMEVEGKMKATYGISTLVQTDEQKLPN